MEIKQLKEQVQMVAEDLRGKIGGLEAVIKEKRETILSQDRYKAYL